MSGETAVPQVKRYVIQVNLDGRGARARWNKQLYSQIALAGYSEASVQKGKAIASEIIFENKHSDNIGYVKPTPQQITAIVEAIKNQSTAGESVEDSINTAFKNILKPLNKTAFPEINKWASDSAGPSNRTQQFADSGIANYMVTLFKKIATSYGVSLTPLDLFHGHLILYGCGEDAGFGILFHAKEYPSHLFDEEKIKEGKKLCISDIKPVETGPTDSWKDNSKFEEKYKQYQDYKNYVETLDEDDENEKAYARDMRAALSEFYNILPSLKLTEDKCLEAWTNAQKKFAKRNFLWTASNGKIRVIIDNEFIDPLLDPRTPSENFIKTQAVEQQLFGYEFGAINYFPGTDYEKPFVKGSKVPS